MNDPPVTVLLIDDQAMIGETIRRMLAPEEDIVYHYCQDPTQALRMARDCHPTVILQDLVMPDLDGLLLLRFLRAQDATTGQIPVIVLSNKEEPKIKAKAFEFGANDYLIKLPSQAELIARVRYHSTAFLNLQKLKAAEKRLKAENIRLNAELDVTRRLQQMILPKEKELQQIPGLEISGFMEPALEVGGDYYDVIYHNGQVTIGIGDVTGHGLESGVLMIMVQTAVRTMIANNESDPTKFLNVINRTIFENLQRINSDKNLTLSLIEYEDAHLRLSGQHEAIILVRSEGQLELIDTNNLGFPVGLEADIQKFIAGVEVDLNPNDIIVLYTDGVTEAENRAGELYGLEQLCAIIQQNWQCSAAQIQEAIIDDLRAHIGSQPLYDDITLLVLKQK